MRKALRAAALALALYCPIYAGDISNPSVVQPPPRGVITEEQTPDSEVQAGDLTETVLSLLESVLSIF